MRFIDSFVSVEERAFPSSGMGPPRFTTHSGKKIQEIPAFWFNFTFLTSKYSYIRRVRVSFKYLQLHFDDETEKR